MENGGGIIIPHPKNPEKLRRMEKLAKSLKIVQSQGVGDQENFTRQFAIWILFFTKIFEQFSSLIGFPDRWEATLIISFMFY